MTTAVRRSLDRSMRMMLMCAMVILLVTFLPGDARDYPTCEPEDHTSLVPCMVDKEPGTVRLEEPL